MTFLGFGIASPTEYDAVRDRSGAVAPASEVAVFPLLHSARLTDLLVSLLLIGRTAIPGLPLGSFDQLGLFVLVMLAVFRRPIRAVPVWFPGLALGLMAFLTFESAVNGIEPAAFVQRVLNISLSLVTVGFMASGRLDVAAMVKGIGIALALNTVLFYAGIAPRPYGEFLTGYMADKNVAGLFFATMPFLIAASQHRWWMRLAVLATAAPLLWLTGSRTSMAAFAAGCVWMAVASRTNWLGKLLVGIGLYTAFVYASDNLSHLGRFADREGSDVLRSQIDAATAIKVAATPWYGQGLSTATVETDGTQWFFHDSYAALWVEGGIVMAVLVIALYGGMLLALSRMRIRMGAGGTGAAPVAPLVSAGSERIADPARSMSSASPAELAVPMDLRERLAGGGVGAFAAVVSTTVKGLAHRARDGFAEQATAAALVAVLLCARRLGEVFMAQAGFIVVGVALALLLQGQRYEDSPWVLSTQSRSQ